MTKTEIKQQAQQEIMECIQAVFGESTEEGSEMYNELDKQMKRVEKLFGYTPGSWTRGT